MIAAPGNVGIRIIGGSSITVRSFHAPGPWTTTARWIADGLARRIVEWKREELAARQQIARRVFGWRAPRPSAPHVWLTMPPHTGAEDFVEQARLRGVVVSASPAFGVGPARPEHAVRLCLGPPATRDALEAALRILAGVLKDPPRPHAAVV